MIIIQLKLAPWDRIFEFDRLSRAKIIRPEDFKIGEYLVVRIDSHTDLGKVVGILEKEEKGEKEEKEIFIIRKASPDDFKNIEEKKKRKEKILKKANEIAKRHKLSIKLIDAHLSLDAGQIIFAFTSSGRIDFRELVKDLSKEFHRSIRMHQVNPREEMKVFSGFGPCGLKLCCQFLLGALEKVTTDLIEEQQLLHRGAERLSGLCGRLKCCLSFEKDLYREKIKKFPSLGTKLKIKGQEGEVVNWHILKESIDLKIGKDTIIEVKLDQLKNE